MQLQNISGQSAHSITEDNGSIDALQSDTSGVEQREGTRCPELDVQAPGEALEGRSEAAEVESCLCPGNLRHSRAFVPYRHTADPSLGRAIDILLGQVLLAECDRRQSQVDQGFQTWRVGSGKAGESFSIEVVNEQSQSIYPNAHQLEQLGFRGVKGKGDYRQLCRHLWFVVLDALHANQQDPSLWVGYSRNDASYLPLTSRYNRHRLSKHFLVQAVELLALHGLLHHWCAPVGGIGLQSRFCSTPRLIALLPSLSLQAITRDYSLVEVVELRAEKNKHTERAKRIDYDDDDTDGRSAQWRRTIHLINQNIADAELTLAPHSDAPAAGRVDYSDTHLRRIFNNADWNQGGRFYGGWWQRIPSASRRHITIGGQPTVEVDFRQLHPTMLYADAELPVPANIYDLPGLDPKKVKRIFSSMLNAANHQQARESVRHGEELGEGYLHYIAAIRQAHPAIQFYNGVGLLLQCRDSHMAEQIMLRLIERGVTVLPVHDSFIVKAEHEGLLVSVMDAVFHEHYPHLNRLSNGQLLKVMQADGTSRFVGSGVHRQIVTRRHATSIPLAYERGRPRALTASRRVSICPIICETGTPRTWESLNSVLMLAEFLPRSSSDT